MSGLVNVVSAQTIKAIDNLENRLNRLDAVSVSVNNALSNISDSQAILDKALGEVLTYQVKFQCAVLSYKEYNDALEKWSKSTSHQFFAHVLFIDAGEFYDVFSAEIHISRKKYLKYAKNNLVYPRIYCVYTEKQLGV